MIMTNSAIKAVLLDYGGVIAEEGFQNGLRAMAREQGLDPEAMMMVAKHAVYDSGFILGQGSEQAFWTMMREGSGLTGSDAALTARVLDGFVLRDWMIEQIQQWRARGLLTVILSDQSHWLDLLNQRDNFFDHFDHVFNSYYLGKGKRDPSLFADIAGELSLSPEQILFVDDMKGNIDRAQEAGWQAIFYVDKASCLQQFDELLG